VRALWEPAGADGESGTVCAPHSSGRGGERREKGNGVRAPPAMTKPSRETSNAREAVCGESLYLVESAPIESNMTEKPQFSASPAPQKQMSCLPSWICSIPTPMQCAPVEHADEIEYETPCSLKAVESTAETDEPIARVTRYGPMRRFLPALTASTVSVMSATDVPPWPRMPPTRGELICSSFRPESSIARCMLMYAYIVFSPMKRNCLRSMNSLGSMSGRPQTCDFMPTSWYFSLMVMPDLHSRSDVDTSSRVFPRHETMPMPVTTTLRPPCSHTQRKRTHGLACACQTHALVSGWSARAPSRLLSTPFQARTGIFMVGDAAARRLWPKTAGRKRSLPPVRKLAELASAMSSSSAVGRDIFCCKQRERRRPRPNN
jgi:hypothetical protein